MTDDEARKLAQRCIDTWPNGPKAYIWRDTLLPLNPGPAARAYRLLVDEAERTPTIARYKAHYATLTRGEQSTMIRWNGDEIGMDEYLRRLTTRAGLGNQDAADELEDWTKWLSPKGARL